MLKTLESKDLKSESLSSLEAMAKSLFSKPGTQLTDEGGIPPQQYSPTSYTNFEDSIEGYHVEMLHACHCRCIETFTSASRARSDKTRLEYLKAAEKLSHLFLKLLESYKNTCGNRTQWVRDQAFRPKSSTYMQWAGTSPAGPNSRL